MPLTFVFTVDGPPVPAARPRATRFGEHVRVYTPKSNAEWMERVRASFRAAFPLAEPITRQAPVEMSVTFRIARPKSHYRTGKNAELLRASAPVIHTQRPDLDNLLKGVKDALNGLAFADDSQVAEYGHMAKVWTDGPAETAVIIREKMAAGVPA